MSRVASRLFPVSENARLQEDAAGPDLPDLQHDSAQLCPLVSHLPNLLLRVRGTPLGHRQTGQSGISDQTKLPGKYFRALTFLKYFYILHL